MNTIYSILICFVVYVNAYAQTCCTAGAPLSSAIGIQNPNKGILNLTLNYEYKSINALVDQNIRLQNDPRSRSGQNFSLKLDFAVNQKWAFSLIAPLVYQERNTISETENSLGRGDLSLIAQRSFLGMDKSLFLSAGIKLPTGITNHRSDSNIFLSPDMQSGSGSVDYLIGLAFQKTKFCFEGLGIDFSNVYRLNTQNENFGSTNNFPGRKFAFGNELVTSFRIRQEVISKIGFLVPELALKFRFSTVNKEQNIGQTNSGGKLSLIHI